MAGLEASNRDFACSHVRVCCAQTPLLVPIAIQVPINRRQSRFLISPRPKEFHAAHLQLNYWFAFTSQSGVSAHPVPALSSK
jgi:hypothetical protein